MSSPATIGASAAAVRFHYDVGNEFYALWLDRTRTYSCGMWLSDEDDLEQAQINKMDWHLRNVGLRQGAKLLDIGCGWGATMVRAVHCYQAAEATGLTLSVNQEEWIKETAPSSVHVKCESWEAHRSPYPYDAVVSIGAFEHFARLDQDCSSKLKGYRAFFEFCHNALGKDGRLALQTIMYETADRADFSPFFAQQVFPESDLPHLEEIVRASRGLFEIETLRNDRAHYVSTLRHWLTRLRKQRAEAVSLVGEAVVARYEQYFNLLIIGFHRATMNLGRMVLRRL